MWEFISLALLLILVGFAGGYLWWGVAYHELLDEVDRRDRSFDASYSRKVMRSWDNQS